MAEVCEACGEKTILNAAFYHACGAPCANGPQPDAQRPEGPRRNFPHRDSLQPDSHSSPSLASARGEPAPENRDADVPASASPTPERPRSPFRESTGRENTGRGKSSRRQDEENVLWQGGYCWRAMVGSWALACVLTLALPLAAWIMKFSSQGWFALGALLGALWLGLAIRLAYRQLSVHYYLTNQRFMYEQGLLWRQIDRIEAIDIDDVSYRQGPVERILGVGTVNIRSSDVSTPAFSLVGIDAVDKVASLIDEARRQERLRRGLYLETT